jgi:phage terminase small subunit
LAKLTAKQKRFVNEYLIDLNATQAAIRAGYSPRTARAIGHENLTKPDIRAAVDRATADRGARTRIEADRVLAEVEFIAFSDIRDIDFDANGKLIETTPGATRAVAGYTYSRRARPSGTTIQYSVRLWDKLGALQLLMRHFGLLDRPITLETVLAVLPLEISSLLRRLIAEAACDRSTGTQNCEKDAKQRLS